MLESQADREHVWRTALILMALTAILGIGSAFRFYNVNWDEGTYHIHPDERHTTMVITAIQWPASLGEYFDTSHSPLNPRNANTVYFYGTFPLFLNKVVATLLGRTGYDEIHLVGRVLSALFDLGSVLLLFFLARRLFDWRVGLVASFLLALTVLNIQGSHYFAVDTFLTFFVALTIWFTLDVVEGLGNDSFPWPSFVALGASMGFTLSCKVSVFLLAVVVGLGAWLGARRGAGAIASRCAPLPGSGEPGPVRLETRPTERGARSALLRATAGLILAVIVSIAVFRVAQPYAWAGPNYDGWDTVPEPWGSRLRVFEQAPEPVRAIIMPNPQWIADIGSAGAQQTGEADLPWGRQWTERTPWLYPLENMVLWGMGLPLGIASWAGVGLAIFGLVQNWRRRRRPSGQRTSDGKTEPILKIGPVCWSHWDLILVVLAWVCLTFVWQGMQFVKSIRYFLPIYPFLVAFAAYFVVSVWDGARHRQWGIKVAAGAWGGMVLVGTLAWAVAFIQIYREPITRVQATRWMYEHVESGATLHYRTADGQAGKMQMPLPSSHTYAPNGLWLSTPFTPPQDLIATQVVMNHITSLEGPREGVFEIQIVADPQDPVPLAQAEIETTFDMDVSEPKVLKLAETALAGQQTYYFQSRVVRGAPLVSKGSAIANEHFDDPLPFNMFGYTAYMMYRGLELTLYDEDTPEKLEKLLDTLDEADYISMSSGRLWQSIPRLPMRYPVTTRYYELLFAEKLGFEKAVEFHSTPRLLGIEFDDTWAEEQFTVYDHPKVLIYRKTDSYDRERVQAMLSDGIDWDNIPHWLNPRDVPEWKRTHEAQNDLKLSTAQRELQEQGGTWASLFNKNSLANHWPTLTWLILTSLIGLATLPLTVAVFQWLPDRGYILSRVVGVLLLGWLSWNLTNLTPLHYSRGTILLALALIACASLLSLALPSQRRRLVHLWRTKRGLMLVSEVLFLAFFVLFWLIRWGNPDLWHPWKGGEKPMDLAYLNAVIKSTEFPPYDPWFAGGYLNYYYFGQVMIGTLIKLGGIMPAVAYNLAIPSWFAMTAMGAFSVTYNLVAAGAGAGAGWRLRLGRMRRTAAATDDEGAGELNGAPCRPVFFGLVGAVFVAILGNLAQAPVLLLKLGEGVMESFQSTIPGLAGLVRAAIGSFEVVFGGRALPIGIEEWYWNASRAIPAGPGESVITEFPFFTFLYADLHAHLIAMPLTFLSLALALALVTAAKAGGQTAKTRPSRRKRGGRTETTAWREGLRSAGPLLLWGLIIGAMRTTNTWDVPPHLIVVGGALVIAEHSRSGLNWRTAGAVAWKFALVALLGWSVLYQPFWANYGSFYNTVSLWTGTRTPLWAYLVVHGLFLFAIVSYLSARVIGDRRRDPLLRRLEISFRHCGGGRGNRAPTRGGQRDRLEKAARIVGVRGLPVSYLVWIGLGLLVLLEVLFVFPELTSLTRPRPDALEAGAFAYRGLGVFALGVPVAAMGLLLFFRPRLTPTERLWALLVLLGLAMSLGVELVVIRGDIGRMNTVFKFYLQVWLMWGVSAAVALGWLLPRLRHWRQGQGLWLTVLCVLVLAAALYPPLATAAKTRDRFDTSAGPGLDGWAYMETARYYDPKGVEYELKWDLEAMRWLLDNVVGSPVILEGHTSEYRWGGRYSVNTGLPTVLGWNWHQRQQRAAANDQEVWDRANDVAEIYNTPSNRSAELLLRQYGVRYVVVGPLERAYYVALGLDKFERMVDDGTLRVAFRNEKVTIYQVTW